jgi:glycosyltransferase involved in cell wall biosynthesis
VKIAIIGPVYPYRGGIAHYTARLAQEIAKQHEVKVFSFKKQYPAWLYPGRSDKDPSPKAIDVSVAYTIDSLNPLSWLHTANEIRRYHPDVLIIEWWVTFLAPAFATIAHMCGKSKIPVMFLIHNVLPHEKSRLHRPLALNTFKNGTFFIVHSPKERERLQSLITHAKVEVCPFPLFDMVEPASLSVVEARRQLNVPETGNLVLFFGIVRPYKGLIYLIEALALLREKIPDITLVVAGEFWDHKSSYQQRADELGLTGHIRLIDRYIPDEEVGVYFKAADLVVAPYIGGTQSAVSALALGFGTPLLATEWSTAGIDVANNEMVGVVPSGDVNALAKAIRVFLENPHIHDSTAHVPITSGWETIVATIEKMVR